MTELSAAVDDQSIMFKGTLENQKIPSFSFRKKYQNFAKTTYNVWPPFKKVPVLEKNETIARTLFLQWKTFFLYDNIFHTHIE